MNTHMAMWAVGNADDRMWAFFGTLVLIAFGGAAVFYVLNALISRVKQRKKGRNVTEE